MALIKVLLKAERKIWKDHYMNSIDYMSINEK